MHRRGPDGTGVHAMGRVAFGHRRLKILDLSECGAQPMVDNELGLTTVFNGLIYNFRELTRGAGGPRLPLLLHHGHRGAAQGLPQVGPGVRRALPRHVRLRRSLDRDTGVLTLGPRPAGDQAAVLHADARTGCGSPRALPALLRGRRGRHVDRQGRPAPLHELPLGRPGAAHDPATASASCPRRRCAPSQPDGTFTDHVYWRPEHVRRPEFAGMSSADWRDAVLAALRLAVKRRMVADVPVGVLLSGGLDSSLVVGLLAQEGQRGLKTFSVGFHATAGESGDEFEYSDLVAAASSARTTSRSSSTPTGCSRPSTRRSRRWPSRWSATTAWPSTCCRRRSRSRSRWCSPGRARTRCSPATAGTRRWPEVPRDAGPGGVRQGLHRPPARRARAHPRARLAARRRPVARLHPRALRDAGRGDDARRRAADGLDDHAGRRPGEAGRQHDHGVGAGSARPLPRP